MTEFRAPYPDHEDAKIIDGDTSLSDERLSQADPEQLEEFFKPYLLTLTSISAFVESRKLKALATRPSTDPELRRMGGKKICKQAAVAAENKARNHYLESQNLPSSMPANASSEEMDAYYSGVKKWATFRDSTLSNPDELAALEQEIEQKLQQFLPNL